VRTLAAKTIKGVHDALTGYTMPNEDDPSVRTESALEVPLAFTGNAAQVVLNAIRSAETYCVLEITASKTINGLIGVGIIRITL